MSTESVIAEIASERHRQKTVEGWTAEHDDRHSDASMAMAASCYADADPYRGNPPLRWPWALRWWKPTTRRRDLIKAAALIVAEIERLDRAEGQS